MTQELRERVAKAIVEADVTPEGSVADLMSCPGYMKNIYGFADAAISIIRAETLEEAARECEAQRGFNEYHHQCAAAIRALKEKP